MTSTPVKAAGSAAREFAQIFGSLGKTGESGFQEILNFQTDRNGAQRTPVQETASAGTQNSLHKTGSVQGESLKTKNAQNATASAKDKGTPKGAELTGEEKEEILEVLGNASAQLMEQLSQMLGMTNEEMQNLLGQLGMEPLQLLNPEDLSAFLLAAAGVEDSLSLITNGELYQDYKLAMELQNALLQQAGEELGLESGALSALAEELMNAPVEAGVGEAASVEITVDEAFLQEEMPKTDEGAASKADSGMAEGEIRTDAQPLRQSAAPDGQTDDGNAGKNRQEHANGQNANVFQQELKPGSLQAQVQQSGESALVWDADTQDIMKQIMDYMKIQIKPDVSNLEMQLHPESLGTVHVQVVSKGGAVTAHFITQNETVKAALESQMVQLKESFQEQGVKVEAVEVSVQTHQFERNLEQGRGRQQEQAAPKGRARRINLHEPLDLEKLEQEEALAAELMAATGSTVDFTA